jgi:hypothetical protein
MLQFEPVGKGKTVTTILKGNGKLLDESGDYICDTAYHVTIQPAPSGKQAQTGTIDGIKYTTMITLPGRYLTLQAEDGAKWDIGVSAIKGLPPHLHCEIVVNSEIEV